VVLFVRLAWPDLARLGSLRDLAMHKIPEPAYLTTEHPKVTVRAGRDG
jgi:hypothetical protein